VETDPDRADRETVLNHTVPVQVLQIDVSTGRDRDVSVEYAEEILERTALDDLPADAGMFVSLRAGLRV
jgi:hypothetical protein